MARHARAQSKTVLLNKHVELLTLRVVVEREPAIESPNLPNRPPSLQTEPKVSNESPTCKATQEVCQRSDLLLSL